MGSLVTSKRISVQRQQAPIPKDAKKLPKYLFDQRRNLQRDWAKVSQTLTEISMVGTMAQIPPAGAAGRFFLATDTHQLFVDTGAGVWFGIYLPLEVTT